MRFWFYLFVKDGKAIEGLLFDEWPSSDDVVEVEDKDNIYVVKRIDGTNKGVIINVVPKQ